MENLGNLSMIENYPKISVCIPSVGRYNLLKGTIESFLMYNTYPNIEILVYESENNEALHKAFPRAPATIFQFAENKQYLQQLHDAGTVKVFFYPWTPMENAYKFLVAHAADYFIFMEDDITTFADPKDHFIDSIKVIDNYPEVIGVECSTSLAVAYIGDSDPPGGGHSRITTPIIDEGIPPHSYVSPTGSTGGAGIMPVLKLWQTSEAEKIGFGTKVMRSVERTFRDDVIRSKKHIAMLLNSWGWCGHTGNTSIESTFTKQHLQAVCDIYTKFATKGMVGPRDINMPWGSISDRKIEIKWDE